MHYMYIELYVNSSMPNTDEPGAAQSELRDG